MGSDAENGTPRTRQSPGNTRTDMFRPWTSTLSSTQGTSPTTGQFSTLPKTLTFRPTLIQSAFPSQRSCSTSRHASPQDGERISSEPLAITRLFSRRSTCQLLATTSARPPSGPPGLARGSSLTTPSSALEGLMARTLAREMEAALWSARASSTQLLTSRLASLLGVSDVVRTTLLASTPLCPRVPAGSTTPCPASLVSGPAPIPATGASQLSSARPG